MLAHDARSTPVLRDRRDAGTRQHEDAIPPLRRPQDVLVWHTKKQKQKQKKARAQAVNLEASSRPTTSPCPSRAWLCRG